MSAPSLANRFEDFYQNYEDMMKSQGLNEKDVDSLKNKIIRNLSEIAKIKILKNPKLTFHDNGEIKSQEYTWSLYAQEVGQEFYAGNLDFNLQQLDHFAAFLKKFYRENTPTENDAEFISQLINSAEKGIKKLKEDCEDKKLRNSAHIKTVLDNCNKKLSVLEKEIVEDADQFKGLSQAEKISTFIKNLHHLAASREGQMKLLLKKYGKELSQIFDVNPKEVKIERLSDYISVIDQAKHVKKAEYKALLLANLIVNKPTKEGIETLKLELKEVQDKKATAADKKIMEFGALKRSLPEAVAIIEKRKSEKGLAKQLERLEKISPPTSIAITRAGLDFLLSAGTAGLVIVFPKTFFFLTPYVVSSAKSSFEKLKGAYEGKSTNDKNKIRKDIQTIISSARSNPKEFIEKVNEIYKTNKEESEEIQKIVKQIIEAEEKMIEQL